MISKSHIDTQGHRPGAVTPSQLLVTTNIYLVLILRLVMMSFYVIYSSKVLKLPTPSRDSNNNNNNF